MKALFILGYPPGTVPSQRFRCEQWLRLLPKGSIDAHIEPLVTSSAYSILYETGHLGHKASAVLKGLLKRVSAILRARVDAIQRLASDADLRVHLGEQARATVAEGYSGRDWAPKFFDVLERAASTPV